MTNSADPDQLASSEAKWFGTALFAKTGHVMFSNIRVKQELRQTKDIEFGLLPVKLNPFHVHMIN